MITAAQKKLAIDQIAKANNGIATAEAVVQVATNPEHVLHECFNWDNETAAHSHRLDTARRIISSVEVVIEIDDVLVSAISYVRDVRQGRRSQGYVSLDSLAKRREDSLETILIELERIEGGIKRARSIANGLGLVEYLESALANILKARIRIQKRKRAA